MTENTLFRYRREQENELIENTSYCHYQRVNRPEVCGLHHLAFHVESVEERVKNFSLPLICMRTRARRWEPTEKELAAPGIAREPIRTDTYTDKKMTFFHDPDGLPLELHE